jgi:hypothetical protein
MSARLAGGALVVLAVIASASVSASLRELATPRDLHGEDYVGSGACARCHADHHASWSRTHHRRMTREATEENVLGRFDGSELDYGGWRARTERSERGEYVVTLRAVGEDAAAPRTRWVVERVVGSRRHQQLLAREDDLWVRLPIAWNVEEQRWMHMNGAFLTADPDGLDGEAPIASADYMRHAVRWNDNCVFCHNVGAEPRMRGERFDTRVAELGVACEACHGPGRAHVEANTSPVRRYVLHETERADPTIVAPSRLSDARSTDVCARCHGQRITRDVGRYLDRGDPFVPGDDLAESSHPLAIDTPLHGDPTAFAPRFWQDGTARLTAYEHQGIVQSRCAASGALACTDCHAMHAGDPEGQLRPDRLGDRMCAGECHTDLARESAARAHSGHAVSGHDAVACVECHMPRIVYGIRTIHRSHRIEVPRPLANRAAERPDACTLCHADRSAQWAAAAIAARGHEVPESASTGSRIEDELFAGDPIERAVAAAALGREARGERTTQLGWLLDVMAHDPYPAVRGIAWRSVLARGVALSVDAFTATDGASGRAAAVARIAASVDARAPDPERVAEMRARASERAIEIGE